MISIVPAINVLTLWVSRETAIEHARNTLRNVAAILASYISRTVESTDQSLQTLVGTLNKLGTRNLGPQVRHGLLFSPTAPARYVTSMGVTDDRGQLVDGCCSLTHHRDFSDRGYFIVRYGHVNVGLYVSGVYGAQSCAGVEAIALSRRMGRRDGTFAGVVLVAIGLNYFKQLLKKLNVGPRGVTAVVRTDDTLLARNPPPSAARAPGPNRSLTSPRMVNQESSFYVASSSGDGVLRFYMFQRVPGTPFIAVIAPAMSDTLASWQRLPWIVGLSSLSAGLASCAGVWPLAFVLWGRIMAENHLHELIQADPLTGLENRRALDVALENEWNRLQRNNSRLSVLFIDADHLKCYNDAHDYAQSDIMLQHLAQCTSKYARWRGDLATRCGGKEFMVLLPGTNEAGVTRIAEAICAEVEGAGAHVPDAGVAPFIVSVGRATARHASLPSRNVLTKAADDTLYEAKRKGYNRVDYVTAAQPYVGAGPDLQTEQSRKLAAIGVDRRLVCAARAKASN